MNIKTELKEYKFDGFGRVGIVFPYSPYNNSLSFFNIFNRLLINELALKLYSLKVILFSNESYDEYLL